LRREDRRAGVIQPGLVEEEALLLAWWVVSEEIEQRVHDAERVAQVRGRDREVVHGRAQVLHSRSRDPRERPQLVADDRRRLAQERAQVAQRRSERAREWLQRGEGRRRHAPERI